MAAFTPIALGAADFPGVGSAFAPEERILVKNGAFTASAQQEFYIIGKPQVIAIAIDSTAAGVSPSTVPTVEYFDVQSQTWKVLLTGAAITAAGFVILKVGPHATDVTNLSANTALYQRMRINMTHGNGTSHTYGISISAI